MESVPSTPGTFTPLSKFGHPLQRGVMPLLTKPNGQEEPIGTGFMIGPDGLMMTAAHVVKEAFRTRERRLSSEGKFYDHYELYALYVTDQEHGEEGESLGGLLPVEKVWSDPITDIALCWLSRPILETGPLQFALSKLSPGIPDEGEHILGFGYYQMKAQREEKERDGKIVVSYEHQTALTPGEIIKVYPEKRDDGMLKWPCFETNARFDSGMSGGPIWNEHGSVCGVICSSSNLTGSYGALIWPSLGIYIDAALSDGGPIQKITLLDLIKNDRVCADETVRDVTVVWEENNKRRISVKRSKKPPTAGPSSSKSSG